MSERWSETESQNGKRLFEQQNETYDFACQAIRWGNLQAYYQNHWDSWKLLREEVQTRDSHIARNLDNAEQSIRDRQPALRSKPNLHLIVPLGSSHSPEKHMSTPARVVVIDTPRKASDNLMWQYHTHQMSSLCPEDSKHIMLAFTYDCYLMEKHLPVNSDELLSMSVEALERKLLDAYKTKFISISNP